ncbi:MAG: aminotransferase class I/II-fold pyridoxal phosphate-dependent enzyme [Candidatus Latescibacteria bacterium]|jgi:histidinol-phosphate aminotransferase|nr:aminotransferase class I/II-fold pyridoxal phosphate-dependent enzyme [Candidatus Latescibacterota bacterium]
MSDSKKREIGAGFSRRGFLKGAIAGAGVAAFGLREAAAQMLQGPSAQPVRGWGVPPGLVRLSGNEMPIGPSPRAVEAIMKVLYSFNRYGRVSEIYEKVTRMHGLPVPDMSNVPFGGPPNSWVTFGAGSSEVLFAAASAFLRDGGETIEATPGYGNISEMGVGFGAKPVFVPVRSDFSHDLPAMKKAINSNTKMIILTSPGNPTGVLIPYEELKAFVASIPPEIIVFSDEAYIDFARSPEDRIGAAPLIKDHPNLIVARTFSKIYGMAGLGIGYGLAQPAMIKTLNLNKGGRVNMLSLHAANAALDDHDYIAYAREVTSNGKEFFAEKFKEMGLEYVPSESSFMLVNIKKDADEVCRKLEQEYRVIVGNGNARWGMKTWLRVTAGLPEENEAFMAALQKVLVSS